MIIFVYGEDGFRVNQKVKQLTTAYQEKFDASGLNLNTFDAKDKGVKYGDALQSICSLPFLSEKRMVVIQNILQTKKTEVTKWVEGLQRTPESTIVVLQEIEKAANVKKSDLFKKLQSEIESHEYEFKVLEGAKLRKWIQERVSERNASINTDALNLLLQRLGIDMWQMDQEIAKLCAYANNEPISNEMVMSLTNASFEGKIFQLMDAVSQKQPARAVALLDEERKSGANDHYIFTMLLRQLRILMQVSAFTRENPSAGSKQIADSFKLHPYVAKKSLDQCRRFDLETLLEVHRLLYEYEHMLKRGQIKASLSVDLIAQKLIK